jgi:hypothetical protein
LIYSYANTSRIVKLVASRAGTTLAKIEKTKTKMSHITNPCHEIINFPAVPKMDIKTRDFRISVTGKLNTTLKK